MSARDCAQGTCLRSSRGSVPAAGPDLSCQPGSWSQTWSGCPSPASSVRGGQAVPMGTAVARVSTPSLPCSVTCRGLVLCMRKGLLPGNSPGRRAAGPVWEDGARQGSQDPAAGKSSRAFPRVPRQAPRSPQAGTSKSWHFSRSTAASAACRGAAFSATRRHSFLLLSQCSGSFCSGTPRGVTSLAPVRPCPGPHTLSSLPGAAGGSPLASCPRKS